MSNKKKGKALYLVLAFLLILNNGLFASKIYDKVYKTLTQYDHRLPGSSEYYKVINNLESILKNAGLKVNRQSYDTYVPTETELNFQINGEKIDEVHTLAPGHGALNTTYGKTLEGDLVYIEDMRPDNMNDIKIAGNIVLINYDSYYMRVLFEQGAKAVIFVGKNEFKDIRLGKLKRHSSRSLISLPRLYISKKTANKYGLFESNKRKIKIKLKISSTMKEVKAYNLWIHQKSKGNPEFNLRKPEMFLLTAMVGTFGHVPTYCPDYQDAANAAFMAELAVRLKKANNRREFLFAFLGSHHNNNAGLRYLYYSYMKSSKGRLNKIPLPKRAKNYQNEITQLKDLISIVETEDILGISSDNKTKALQLIRQKIVSEVNDINYKIYQINRDNYGKNINEKDIINQSDLIKKKKELNTIRKGINNNKIEKESKIPFQKIKNKVVMDLKDNIDEVKNLLNHNKTHQKLAEVFKKKIILNHFHFNLISAKKNWTLGVHTEMGFYVKSLFVYKNFYEQIHSKSWKYRLLTETLNSEYRGSDIIGLDYFPCTRLSAEAMGITGYNIVNIGIDSSRRNLPEKKHVNLKKIISQFDLFFKKAANEKSLSIRSSLKAKKLRTKLVYDFSYGKHKGFNFDKYSRSATTIEGPAKGAIIYAFTGNDYNFQEYKGGYLYNISKVLGSGYAFVPISLEGGRFIKGQRGVMPIIYDKSGAITMIEGYETGKSTTKRLYHAYGGSLLVPYYPEGGSKSEPEYANIFNGISDSKFFKSVRISKHNSLISYYDKEINFKFITDGAFVINASKENPKGKGISHNAGDTYNLNILKMSANDYFVLNESRLSALRKRNIINNSLELLHVECKEYLKQANEARKKFKNSTARALETMVVTIGNKVYNPLKKIVNDMVNAVVILLLLTIPFAFAMERLIFGSTNIFKQISGFLFFFIITFVLLYLSHPAFSLANAPVIIFLAFIIILLSAIVVYIIMTRFRHELKALQGLASKSHQAEKESSTGMAAVLIGISSMRNRPLKTTLTAITVILLTFTILVFASFTSSIGVTVSFLGKGEGKNKIEIHNPAFSRLQKPIKTTIKTLYQEKWDVVTRNAEYYNPSETYKVEEHGVSKSILINEKTKKIFELEGIIGLDPKEFELNPKLNKLNKDFIKNKRDSKILFLSKVVADELGLRKGDNITKKGKVYLFGGYLNIAELENYNNIDKTKILPPDFISTLRDKGSLTDFAGETLRNVMEDLGASDFVWSNPELVGLTYEGNMDDSKQNMIVLYPKRDNVNIEKAAKKLAVLFNSPIYAKSEKGVRKFFFTETLKGSGYTDILIPLVIGALIIFSSLLGSIVDREKEIFTFSALGLAPPDVAMLFFAESSIYAILGGMGGYLLSQVGAKILTVLSTYSTFKAPELNFSSSSSVITIIVVMATVILSTIFPAIKAGKSANPGVARKWKMPEPEGNTQKFLFPFTISTVDIGGIFEFIKEHFSNHSETTLGNFAATNNKVVKKDDGNVGIKSNIAIAPFDLGVMQKFEMYTKNSDIPGIKEIIVEMERVAGTKGPWLRGNRNFIDDLRNQFLLWRSLPFETITHYRKLGEQIK